MSSRRYTATFKMEAVMQVIDHDRPVREVAKKMGVNQRSLYKWIRPYARHTIDSKLDLALWASGEELWDLEVVEGRLIRSGRIPGLERLDDGLNVALNDFFATVHPDDYQPLLDNLEQVKFGTQKQAELTYRIRDKFGSWVWLHSRGRVVSRSAEGEVTRIMGTTRDVTALKRNETRLEFALRAAGEELWEVDRKTGLIRRENPISEVGYSDGDFIMTRTQFGELLHHKDITRVTDSFFAVLKGGAPEFSEVYRLLRKDGRYAWIFSQGRGLEFDDNGLPQRMLGISRDITPFKVAEERLRLSLWGSRAELWDMDMATGLIHRECRLEHLALCVDSITFSELLQIVHESDVDTLKNAMVAHAKGTKKDFEAQYRVLGIKGEWRWVLARGRVTERAPGGYALRMLGTLHDISDLKLAEEELRRLNLELEDRVLHRTEDLLRTNEELVQTVHRLHETQTQLVESEKMSSLGSLVAGIAHEINTPLGISVTAASHLRQVSEQIGTKLHEEHLNLPEIERYGQALSQCADLILRNLQRADRLVKSFKQVAVDQSSEQMRDISLKDYLEEILLSLNPKLKTTKHQVILDCNVGIQLMTYPGAIYQTITNLILNSLIHGFEGIECGTITIRAIATSDLVVIEYIDDGKGMADDIRWRVFDPFFTTKRGQGGTGLGMHIVYNLVTQLLGGSIRCDGDTPKGVRFEIRIPRVTKETIKAIANS